MDPDIKTRFLTNTDETGRFIIKSLKTNREYYVECIGAEHSSGWGDVDPATKKHTGSYGDKYTGCINEKDSLITEKNGFKNIQLLGEGVSPLSEIYKRDLEYEQAMAS